MSELASAPPEERSAIAWRRLRASWWPVLVSVSLLVLLASAAAFAVGWFVTTESKTTSYTVAGPLMGVQLRVVSGDVALLGSAQGNVSVSRIDRSTFGHGPVEWRSQSGGRLAISSACPKLIVGTCRTRYALAVPANVPVSIHADHGSISVEDYRGSAALETGDGSILVNAFCGHTLRASSTEGRIFASASCSPERLELRSGSGDVAAVVPRGRYRVEATSGTASALVRGITIDSSAPWEIQAVSSHGDVTVRAAS